MRAAYLGRMGRRIDLLSMLSLLRQDGSPVWTVADPRYRVAADNGGYDSDGDLRWPGRGSAYIRTQSPCKNRTPQGMPPLPARVRQLVTDPAIRRRANRVGVLYQPEEWMQVRPDPALVVEWRDRPGEYYALAVWGADLPKIMEWVD
jgi:hypothetical protein